jgi:hypothetical protein
VATEKNIPPENREKRPGFSRLLTSFFAELIVAPMRAARSQRRFWSPLAKSLTAAVAAFLLGWINLLAISDQCHIAVHGPDATSHHHQCAATLLAQGKILDSCQPLIVPVQAVLPLVYPEVTAIAWAVCEYCFPSSRAPPVLPT